MFAYCWQRLSTKQEHRSRVHNTACLKTDKHVQRVGLPVTVLTWQANVSFCSHRKCQIGLSDTPTGQINANERFGYLYKKTSVTELSLVENKSAGISVSFSDDYCKQQIDWLMITYIALFSTLLSRLTALACGATWVTRFYSAFFFFFFLISTEVVYLSAGMAGATWNCSHLGASSVYTIQPCTMSLHTKPHT